jgi:hypothetical protein
MLKPGKQPEEELSASDDKGRDPTGKSGQGDNLTTGENTRGAQGPRNRKGKLAEPVSEDTKASTPPETQKGSRKTGREAEERSTILTPA